MSFRKYLRSPVAGFVTVLVVTLALLFIFGIGRESGDATVRRVAKPTTTASATVTGTPTTTSTPTSTPSATTPAPATTVAEPPPATTAVPTQTADKNPVVVVEPGTDESTPMIVGALSIVVPDGYERLDGDGLQAVDYVEFVGPDSAFINGREYPAILRMSADGLSEPPLDLLPLLEGKCPDDSEAKFVPQPLASTDMANTTSELTLSRGTYYCEASVFTYAEWRAVDEKGNSFTADYFFPVDRRPAELTEAFKNAHVLD